MTTRRTGWIVGALAVALVLSMLAPGAVLVLAVPVAVVGLDPDPAASDGA